MRTSLTDVKNAPTSPIMSSTGAPIFSALFHDKFGGNTLITTT